MNTRKHEITECLVSPNSQSHKVMASALLIILFSIRLKNELGVLPIRLVHGSPYQPTCYTRGIFNPIRYGDRNYE